MLSVASVPAADTKRRGAPKTEIMQPIVEKMCRNVIALQPPSQAGIPPDLGLLETGGAIRGQHVSGIYFAHLEGETGL